LSFTQSFFQFELSLFSSSWKKLFFYTLTT
jgi:hypothetical protein